MMPSLKFVKNTIFNKQARNATFSKVRLAQIRGPKAAGLFAACDIPKGRVVARYPLVLIADPGDNTSDPLLHYFIEVGHANGITSKDFVGRPDLHATVRAPDRGLAPIGLFANEPSGDERDNVQFSSRPPTSKLHAGQKLVFSLISTVDIQEGDEILVCYGDLFERVGYTCSCAAVAEGEPR